MMCARQKALLLVCLLGAIYPGACTSFSLRGDWNHQIRVSGKTSSREYREEGLLVYQGRLIPDNYRAIVCPIGSFVYRRQPALVNSSSGWLRDEAKMDSLSAAKKQTSGKSGAAFTGDDARQGWYEAGFFARKPGTPVSWIWVDFGSKSYWIKSEGVFYYSTILSKT
ncbi:MAG: hypothetical protein LBC99_00390 [Spirochaetota bacterium]|jgi:hypothetical protein|nr:hypothetical protein [Spirochaetota bacterium]